MESHALPVRILHLDDSPMDAVFIKAEIEKSCDELPASITWVSSKKAYLDALPSGSVDVILCDHRMPGYDGDEALRDARAVCPDVPFIMVSGEMGEEHAIETLKTGATDYVLKDRIKRLVPSIKRALKEVAAERERREQAERYRILAETMLQGVVHQAADGRIISMNPAAERILGKSRETFLGSSSVEEEKDCIREDGSLFPGMEHPAMVALRTGEQQHGVVMGVFNPRRGEYRWISVDAVPVSHPGRTDWSEVYTVFEDITERKRAEEALRESERRYRLMHESLRDPFVQVSMEGRIIECNDQYCDLVGYSREEARVLTYLDLTPERWHAFEEGIVRDQIIPRGYSDVYEKEYRRKDGTVIPVELRTILLRDEAGQPLAMWAVVRDITERKRAEEALRVSEENLRLMVNESSDAMMILDSNGIIEAVSPSGTHLLGYEEGELVGKRADQFAETFSRLEVALKLEDLRKHAPRPVTTSLYIRTKSGKVEMMSLTVRIINAGAAAQKYFIRFTGIDLPAMRNNPQP